MDYKKLLNEQQYEACICTKGPVLVSAGAGSGKTRLLTHRIAYLITECGVPAQNILAITFTNKAAGEMKDRVHKLATNGDLVTVCTIHSFCARMLRTYCSFIPGYKDNFTIYSETDTNKLFRDIFKAMNITDEDTKSKYKNAVSYVKNENMDIDRYLELNRRLGADFKSFYLRYQDALLKNNAMDFDDLLLNFYNLLNTNKEVLTSIQNKYTYFSVDEFQDTNQLQYDLVKLLASKTRNLLIVGDEDQSIYGWRGASAGNMFTFLKDYPDAHVFKLEENYRSTKKILDRANKIIVNNHNRMDKQLFTSNDEGADVTYYPAYNETEEADYVVRSIISKHAEGVPYNEIAILMRLNALSRAFEEKFLTYNIPHIMYNGFKFFERAEIKNVLAYLTAIVNPNDDISFARIINFPKRGIGDTSINKLIELASVNQTSLKAIVMDYEHQVLPTALKVKLKELKELFEDLENQMANTQMYDFFTYMLSRTGITNSYDLNNEDDYEHYLNINQLANSVKEFEENNEDATIVKYLESVTLSSSMDADDGKGVVIATVHGAKGLEFDTVFVVGCEEKIFPISRDDNDDLEEERRLMYVAVTRAKRNLVLTSSSSRFMYGKTEYSPKSRFLYELDLVKDRVNLNNSSYSNYTNKGVDMNKLQTGTNKTFNYTFNKNTVEKKTFDPSKIKVGAKVTHPKFGDGVITEFTPNSVNHCVKIKFDSVGEKMLSLEYAPIEFKD